MHNTKRLALSRTWQTRHSDKMDSVVVASHAHTITLSRTELGSPITATVDGLPVDVHTADCLLKDAWQLEVVQEVLAAPLTIGPGPCSPTARHLGPRGHQQPRPLRQCRPRRRP